MLMTWTAQFGGMVLCVLLASSHDTASMLGVALELSTLGPNALLRHHIPGCEQCGLDAQASSSRPTLARTASWRTGTVAPTQTL